MDYWIILPLENSREMIIKSCETAGLEEAYESQLQPEDPFSDLEYILCVRICEMVLMFYVIGYTYRREREGCIFSGGY